MALHLLKFAIGNGQECLIMLRWSMLCLALAIVGGVFGLTESFWGGGLVWRTIVLSLIGLGLSLLGIEAARRVR